MKIDPRSLLAPAVAALVFLVTLQWTMNALRSSGAWQPKPKLPHVQAQDPYARLEGIFGRPLLEASFGPRDPFGYPAMVTSPITHLGVPRPPGPPPAPQPVLTAIVWDNDPRATIRFNSRDFSVRENSLFADFKVKSITSTQVVLEREGEPLVLTLRSKGE